MITRRICRWLAASAILAGATAASADEAPAWIAQSNRYTQQLLVTEAQFDPEGAAQAGLEQFDGKSVDLGPSRPARLIAAEQKQRATFVDARQAERDPLVRQDLDILIHSIDHTIEGTQLSEQFL